MDDSKLHETNVHDLSLGVIHALAMVDVKALSYVQLRRLYAALKHKIDDVSQEAIWGFSPHGKLSENLLKEVFNVHWGADPEEPLWAKDRIPETKLLVSTP